MIISGYTDNRLNDIKTYSKTSPYQVGVNGVTNITYTPNNDIETISYTIDGINYKTTFPTGKDSAISTINDGTPLKRAGVQNLNTSTRTRSFTPRPSISTNKIEEPVTLYRTTFSYNPGGCEVEDYNVLKDDVKIGVVFPPKIDEEIFIERLSISVFEPHSRMRDIGSLEKLEDYRNGYYNIINLQ
jgi:hypothetical protein